MKHLLSRRALAWALCICVASSAPALAGPSNRRRARVGVRYLVTQQRDSGAVPAFSKFGSTADAVVAMVAARRSPRGIRQALRWLREHPGQATTIGLRAKLVLALVVAGRSPRDFAGRNWVARIRGTELPSGRYGAGTAVFDQALAILALRGAGASPSQNARNWLADAQCPDGGWQFDAPYNAASENQHCQGDRDTDFFRAEADATSLAIQALEADPAVNPFPFLRSLRDSRKHGWGYNSDFPMTNANSTALVLQAYAAEGRDLPRRGVRALKRLQYPLCGKGAAAFAYSWERRDGELRRTGRDVGATIGAIPGLLGKPLPIAARDVTKPAPRPGPC